MPLPTHPSLARFNENVRRVRDLGGLYAALTRLAPPLVDPSDLLRAQIVQLVSALDFYVHDVVRHEMLEIAQGNRQTTIQYGKFVIPMAAVESMLQSLLAGLPPAGDPMPSVPTGLPGINHLDAEIQRQHGFKSFQEPDKITEGLRLITDKSDIWKLVAARLSMSPEDVKAKLKLIAKRRNQIAHEADLDPSSPGARYAISETDVNESIDFVERVVAAIDAELV